MNKPPDETLKQGRNRSWLLVKKDCEGKSSIKIIVKLIKIFLNLGLIDTAVKTAETGYMQRCLVKCLEEFMLSI